MGISRRILKVPARSSFSGMKRPVRPPIIALANDPWQSPRAGRQQILSRLGERGWPVLYSNGPITLWDRNGEEWKQAGLLDRIERHRGVFVHVPGRAFAPWPKFKAWSRWSIRRHYARLTKSITTLAGTPKIFLLFHPNFLPYAEAANGALVIYHAFDAFAMTPGWRDDDTMNEKALVERADLILATSPAIKRKLPQPGPEKSIELHNGVDFEQFASGPSAPVPIDLREIPGPRIGFVGRITPKVDFELVAEIAERQPGWNWVFVGPVAISPDSADERQIVARRGLARCRERPNIHFLGQKHHTELPAYMANMDVNVISNRIGGGWWEAAYPLKIHEYLATGRPVVSSDLETVRQFEDVVEIAHSVDDWIRAIGRAIAGGGVGTAEQRIEIARQNSWDIRVDQLERILLDRLS